MTGAVELVVALALESLTFWMFNRLPKCDVIILQTFLEALKPHHAIETVAVITCANQIANTLLEVKIEKLEVSLSPILTSLIYHWILTTGTSTK